jgi:hypothetical protein
MNYSRVFVVLMTVIFIFSSIKLLSVEQVDIIHLKSGSKIVGKIIKYDAANEVEIQSSDSIRFVFKMDLVEKIEFMVDKDQGYKSTMTEFGGTFGTPAVINLVFGKHFDKYMVKASGMYLGSTAKGIQLELGLKLSEFKNTYHAISLVGGYSYIKNKQTSLYGYEQYQVSEWMYGGIVYNLNTNGFYLQPGLSIGSGSYNNPQIMIQIGYVYQFRE